jgi:hypothetical protein
MIIGTNKVTLSQFIVLIFAEQYTIPYCQSQSTQRYITLLKICSFRLIYETMTTNQSVQNTLRTVLIRRCRLICNEEKEDSCLGERARPAVANTRGHTSARGNTGILYRQRLAPAAGTAGMPT